MEGQKLRKDKYLRCLCSINTVYEDDIGRTNLIEHHIDTKEVNPIKQPPRKVPLAFAEAEKECITQLEKQSYTEVDFPVGISNRFSEEKEW